MSTPVPIWRGSTEIQLDPGFPKINTAWWRNTATGVYRGPYATLRRIQPQWGALGTGDFAGFFVETSELIKEKGGKGVLTVNFTTDDTPPPRPSCEFEKIDIPIEQNPRYADLFNDADQGGKYMALIDDALRASTQADRAQALARINAVSGDSVTLMEIYNKKRRGHDTYWMFAPVASIIESFVAPPLPMKGGFEEMPDSRIPYSMGWKWLRMGDKLTRPSGRFWELQKLWQGCHVIDSDLYPTSSSFALSEEGMALMGRQSKLNAGERARLNDLVIEAHAKMWGNLRNAARKQTARRRPALHS